MSTVDRILQVIDAKLALADAATEGPWERHLYHSGTVAVTWAHERGSVHICVPTYLVPVPGEAGEFTGIWEDDKATPAEIQRLGNAAFIADARTSCPAALRALRRSVSFMADFIAVNQPITGKDPAVETARNTLAAIAAELGLEAE